MSDGLVMKGNLDGATSLGEVLSVVGLSRQWMEVVLHGDDEPQGRILCKSGKLVEAFAPPDRSGVEAFMTLWRGPGAAFAVYQRPAPRAPGEPLGALADLVDRAERDDLDEGGDRTPRAVVVEGTFDETPLGELFEKVGLTRHLVEIEFRDANGPRGTVLLQAGRVLDARCARVDVEGAEAFIRLVHEPGTGFTVVRRPDEDRRPPIGRLEQLVLAAAAAPTTPVLQGRFGDTSLPRLLETVARSRQPMEIRLSREGRPRGILVVRTGAILEARCGGIIGRDAFDALLDDPGTLYRVSRAEASAAEALGSVEEWLAREAPPDPTPIRPTPTLVRDDDDAPHTLDLGLLDEDDAPTTVMASSEALPELEAEYVAPLDAPEPAPLEERLAELAAALRALQECVAATPAPRDHTLLLGMLLASQLVTLALVAGAVFGSVSVLLRG